jgi:hypothetical protein
MIPRPIPRTVTDRPICATTELPAVEGCPNDRATSASAEEAPNWAKPAAPAMAAVTRIAWSCQP